MLAEQFKVRALKALLYQYAFNDVGERTHGVAARVHREIVDVASPHTSSFSESDLDTTYPTINNFLFGTGSLSSSKRRLVEAFLENKGYIDRSWYEDLDRIERSIWEFIDSKAQSSSRPSLDGLYLFEAHALIESMLSYLWALPSARGHVGVHFVQRVYRRGAIPKECGPRFQRRLDAANSDLTLAYYGCAWAVGSQTTIELIADDKEAPVNPLKLRGFLAGDCPREDVITIIFTEDMSERKYVQYLQNTEIKMKNTNLLNDRQKNNIIGGTRFFNSNIDYIYMGPIFFEERTEEFAEVDFDLLSTSRSGDAIGMIRAIMNGANPNVCDPETGKTALHLATASLSPLAVSILVPAGRSSLPGYDTLQSEVLMAAESGGLGDRDEIDFRVRAAQQKLNPLFMDSGHNFASHESGFNERMIPFMKGEIEDPLFEVREDLDHIVGTCIHLTLREQGLFPALHNMDVADRLQEIRAWRQESGGSPAPSAF